MSVGSRFSKDSKSIKTGLLRETEHYTGLHLLGQSRPAGRIAQGGVSTHRQPKAFRAPTRRGNWETHAFMFKNRSDTFRFFSHSGFPKNFFPLFLVYLAGGD